MANGSIEVATGALAQAAGELQQAAQEGVALRGNFSRAAPAAEACDPICADAYRQMQTALAQSLAILQEEVQGFGPKTAQAGQGYDTTERTIARGYAGGAA